MNVQLLSNGEAHPLPETRQSRLARLARATQQMSTLIEGLLEYTRSENGTLNMRLETLDAVALVTDVVEAQRENASSSVSLKFEQASAELPALVSDRRLVQVVISNLVSNALKFTDQGHVQVRLKCIDGFHVVEVHDTGIGIADANLQRVFLPFEQLEPIPRESIPGVGLGLALVTRIVDTLRGKLEVFSKVGAGSTFRVLLPSRPHYMSTIENSTGE